MTKLITKGYIATADTGIFGKFWYREGMNSFHVVLWNTAHFDGYTEEGLYALARRYDAYVIDESEYEDWHF